MVNSHRTHVISKHFLKTNELMSFLYGAEFALRQVFYPNKVSQVAGQASRTIPAATFILNRIRQDEMYSIVVASNIGIFVAVF